MPLIIHNRGRRDPPLTLRQQGQNWIVNRVANSLYNAGTNLVQKTAMAGYKRFRSKSAPAAARPYGKVNKIPGKVKKAINNKKNKKVVSRASKKARKGGGAPWEKAVASLSKRLGQLEKEDNIELSKCIVHSSLASTGTACAANESIYTSTQGNDKAILAGALALIKIWDPAGKTYSAGQVAGNKGKFRYDMRIKWFIKNNCRVPVEMEYALFVPTEEIATSTTTAISAQLTNLNITSTDPRWSLRDLGKVDSYKRVKKSRWMTLQPGKQAVVNYNKYSQTYDDQVIGSVAGTYGPASNSCSLTCHVRGTYGHIGATPTTISRIEGKVDIVRELEITIHYDSGMPSITYHEYLGALTAATAGLTNLKTVPAGQVYNLA